MSQFNEFEPRLKSAKNRFQSSAGLNLEKCNTILSETNHIWAAVQISLNLATVEFKIVIKFQKNRKMNQKSMFSLIK